jgi:hypothetical protein
MIPPLKDPFTPHKSSAQHLLGSEAHTKHLNIMPTFKYLETTISELK